MADTCPRCGFAEVASDKCPQCGVVITTYRASLDKMRRGPQPGGSPFARGPVSRPDPASAPEAPAATPAAAPSAPGWLSAPPPPATLAAAPSSGSRQASFRGSGATLFGIHIVNALLILATLGTYYFWAKVRVRSYLWSESEFEGDRFAYHGTGRELIVGFVRAFAFFLLPMTLLNTLPEIFEASAVVIVATRLLVSILAAIFIPVAIVGARRYRLSRTSWRGIRFSLRTSTRPFVALWVRGWLLTSFTMGLYYPAFVTNQHRFLTSNTWFGSERFAFDGRGRDLIPVWLASIILFVPTVGLSWFWFLAKRQRYYAEHTCVAGARFRSTVTAPKLAWLTISTWIGLLCTLGLAWPWLTVRKLRRTFAWLSLDGPLALDSITQQAQQVTATGEGLAGFFDADLGFT
ncbi:MAG TPA: DUF898 family protein [Methylomirabilota bacterium]|jgi:uncharacterized membrane protein YjgN (DUF898 family)